MVDLLTYDDAVEIPSHSDELNELNEKLRSREEEVINLQKKIIELFEALKNEQVPA